MAIMVQSKLLSSWFHYISLNKQPSENKYTVNCLFNAIYGCILTYIKVTPSHQLVNDCPKTCCISLSLIKDKSKDDTWTTETNQPKNGGGDFQINGIPRVAEEIGFVESDKYFNLTLIFISENQGVSVNKSGWIHIWNFISLIYQTKYSTAWRHFLQ